MNDKLKKLIQYGIVSKDETLMQAELYYQCKIRNIPIFLEQRITKIGRIDAILIINNNIIIVECKYSSTGKRYNIYTEQMKIYSTLRFPLIVIDEWEEIPEIMNILVTNVLKKGIYTYDPTNKILDRHVLKKITALNRFLFEESQREKRKRKRKISENNSNSYRERNVDSIA